MTSMTSVSSMSAPSLSTWGQGSFGLDSFSGLFRFHDSKDFLSPLEGQLEPFVQAKFRCYLWIYFIPVTSVLINVH